MEQLVKREFIRDEMGNKKAVILPIEEYEEMIEDLHDLAVVAERRDEAEISMAEIKQRLKKNGLI
ncbi:MAG: hypothetical protein AB1765_09545 [Candidatus Hydrogenedentota bacterium]